MPKLISRLLLATLTCLPFGGACSSDDAAPAKPIVFNVAVATFDGNPVSEPVRLRCDGTLAVGITITTTPANQFALRPANACGLSTRCGYVRFEAWSDDDALLASVDSATTEGVLHIAAADQASLAQIRVALIRGVDQEPLTNADKGEVTATSSPSFTQPSGCSSAPSGEGGQGGQGSPSGGAGGEITLGGAAGDTSQPGGGAGGVDAELAGAGGV